MKNLFLNNDSYSIRKALYLSWGIFTVIAIVLAGGGLTTFLYLECKSQEHSIQEVLRAQFNSVLNPIYRQIVSGNSLADPLLKATIDEHVSKLGLKSIFLRPKFECEIVARDTCLPGYKNLV